MKTKNIAVLLLMTIFSVFITLQGCKKNEFGDGNGAVMFYVCDDAANCGGVTAEIEGQRHTMTKYFVYCPTPDEGDETSEALFKVVLPSGSYDYTLSASTGSYHGSVNISEGNVSPVQVSGSSLGCSGGNNNNGYLPSGYEQQGTITVRSYSLGVCIRDFATIDGDIIDLVVNGSTLLSNTEVTGTDKCYTLTLHSPNGNWIGVIAKSEGSISPCTPGISIDDGYTTQDFEIRSYVGGTNGAYIINVVL